MTLSERTPKSELDQRVMPYARQVLALSGRLAGQAGGVDRPGRPGTPPNADRTVSRSLAHDRFTIFREGLRPCRVLIALPPVDHGRNIHGEPMGSGL